MNIRHTHFPQTSLEAYDGVHQARSHGPRQGRETDIQLKAGDVVIQRGTNHAWSNRSGKRVRMLYVLINGRFEPELAAMFKSVPTER